MARKHKVSDVQPEPVVLDEPILMEPEFPAVKDELQLTLMRLEAKLDALLAIQGAADVKEPHSVCVVHT